MPFTVSHVAAVLPLHRPLRRLHAFSAAVIGSMVPDFGLLLPGRFARWQTHSLQALITFCLPVGLAAYVLTHVLIKPALLEVLPDGAHERLRRASHGVSWAHPRVWPAVILALLFGALTHLVWDGFTHENARGVRLFPQLLDYGPEMAGHSLRLYIWAQYGSSVVGLALVLAALWLWLKHAPAPQPPPVRRLALPERAVWIFIYLGVPAAAVVAFALRPLLAEHAPLFSGSALGSLAVAAMRATALSLLLVSVLLRVRLG
jgi:Domain of unknown function (DUF4184)